MHRPLRPYVLTLAALLLPPCAWAHSAHDHGKAAISAKKKEQTAWGIAADVHQAGRTIQIRMDDSMRFSPDRIELRQGDTVRLVLVNRGRALHELVLGTAQELKAHAERMKKSPHMAHDQAHMAHVLPGKRVEMVWTFNRPGEFEFACLIPGHFEAGMVGSIQVVASSPTPAKILPPASQHVH
jgi:uncharacterized cupredoxin-like copper-binding protein